MTNEEMADKYAEEYFGKKTELVELWKVKAYKQAFLAGLKAGRPEWHNLRKDPNDLPKEDCETVTLHENGNKNIIKWKYGELDERYNNTCYCLV